jgi:hypothetical protein
MREVISSFGPSLEVRSSSGCFHRTGSFHRARKRIPEAASFYDSWQVCGTEGEQRRDFSGLLGHQLQISSALHSANA